jgi:hypothetical protein
VLEVGDQDLDVLDRGGLLLERDLHARRAGVEQIDGLVGELAAGDVAGREAHRGRDRLVGDDDLVGLLELGTQAAEHDDGLLLARLVDLDGLEATLEGGVLLEVLLVLAPGGRRDGAQLTASEGGLQQVGRVAAALRPPAPMMVWASSMKRMIGLAELFTSLITPLMRFSNSPFTPAPACRRPRSRPMISVPWRSGWHLALAR